MQTFSRWIVTHLPSSGVAGSVELGCLGKGGFGLPVFTIAGFLEHPLPIAESVIIIPFTDVEGQNLLNNLQLVNSRTMKQSAR